MASSSDDNALQLSLSVHDSATLTAAGYVQQQLSLEQLQAGLRCARCSRNKSQIKKEARRRQREQAKVESKAKSQNSASGTEAVSKLVAGLSLSSEGANAARGVCHFHSGVWIRGGPRKGWSCCGSQSKLNACVHAPEHQFPQPEKRVLEAAFQFWPTPFCANPLLKRKAVAIDCEMGQAVSGDSELIRLSMIDASTHEVLIDSLVFPSIPMLHYRTIITGITKNTIQQAAQMGTCIYGRDLARIRVWEYVGPDTIVIGHSAQHDMDALRWIHPRVVDTFILATSLDKAHLASDGVDEVDEETKSAETDKAPLFPSKSLKSLALQLLQREIQTKSNGHDSVEDALATLDLAAVLCPVRNQMLAADLD